MSSSSKAFAHCHAAREDVRFCKAEFGLSPRDCYPSTGYNNECAKFEHSLKRCLSFALCNSRGDASTFYDNTRPRKARVTANKGLQKCLAKHQALMRCVPKEEP